MKNTENESANNPGYQAAQLYFNQIRIRCAQLEFEFRMGIADSDGKLQTAIDARTNPILAKHLYEALGEQIRKYEAHFGEIKLRKGQDQ